jgi:mono/diheme cytochrome c family protein
MGMMKAAFGVALGVLIVTGNPLHAQKTQRGLAIARDNCAMCHSIEKHGESPLKAAPPFRTLHKRYAIEELEEPLAKGIIAAHPSMPEFRFKPREIGDFIAFLRTLE